MKTEELIRWDVRAAVMEAFAYLETRTVFFPTFANSAPVVL